MKRERKTSGVWKRVLALACSLAMAVSLFPTGYVNAEGRSAAGSERSGLSVNKWIELQDDGSYKITMEAWASGQTQIVQKREAVPLDIVLVLDQSGSMAENTIEKPANFAKAYEANTRYVSSFFTGNSYSKDTTYYVLVNGTYYPLSGSATWSYWNQRYYYSMWYVINGNRKYIVESGVAGTMVNVTLYKKSNTEKVSKLSALVEAVESFVNVVKAEAAGEIANGNTDFYHRIGLAGFACNWYGTGRDKKNYQNTEFLTGCTIKNKVGTLFYEPERNNPVYRNAARDNLQNVTTSSGLTNIQTGIDALTAEGATQTDHGIMMASDVFSNDTDKTYVDSAGVRRQRQKVVVVFTDGSPTSSSGFEEAVANAAIAESKSLKDSGTLVYSIGVLDGANPEANITANTSTDINKFLHYVSSNYPDAKMMRPYTGSSWNSRYYLYDRADNSDYYKSAKDAEELNEIFREITQDVQESTSTVSLDENSVLKDTISEYFDIANVRSVSAYTVPGTADTDGNITWNTNNTNSIASGNISLDGKTVKVTGFSYKDKYIASGHPGEKLVVEAIVTAREEAAGLTVPSNIGPAGDLSNQDGSKGDGAGVYEVKDGEEKAAAYFPVPTVTIPKYAYVLDFGKKVTIPSSDEFGISRMMLLNETPMPVASTVNSLTKAFGTFAKTTESLSYTPQKINWNGIDTAYAMGKKSDNQNEWFQTKFIPATSVYYEDDFNTTSGNTDSGVSIVYTGAWSTEKDGTNASDANQSYHSEHATEEDAYGWDDIYTDDTKYSGGSAHVAVGTTDTSNPSKASFTFTGTGVDVYSRTNMTVGQILARVYKVEEGTERLVALRIVDNLYESGDLYQIPTLALDMMAISDSVSGSFLGYGTYRVEIQVSAPVTAHTGTERSTYYLDGIRVYNPMGFENEEANGYYSEDGELSPYVVELRDVLLNAEAGNEALFAQNGSLGAVFIDELKVTNNDGKTSLDGDGIKTFQNYGPKNEVYLAPGQQIAFKVDQEKLAECGTDATRFMIGLKDPDGNGDALVQYSNGTGSLTTKAGSISATDLYYEMTPDSTTGSVVIKNVSATSMLALTKIKITNVTSNFENFVISDQTLQNYILEFNGHAVKAASEIEQESKDASGFENVTESPVTEPIEEVADFDGTIDIVEGEMKEESVLSTIWTQVAKGVEKYFRSIN